MQTAFAHATRSAGSFSGWRRLWLRGLFLVLPLLCIASSSHAATVKVGDAPVLPALHTLDGKAIAPATLRGKTIVLSYFSTECPFCMHEAPKLQKLYHENQDKLIVIGVNIQSQDPDQRQKSEQWVRKYRLGFPVTTDFEAVAAVLGKPKGLPVNFVFDPRGTLIRVDVGEIFDEDFDDIAKAARRVPQADRK